MPTAPSRRIIVVSSDDEVRHQLEAMLRATSDTVETYATLDAVAAGATAAALYVVHAPDERALTSPPSQEGPIIAIVPDPDLAVVVERMQSSRRVAGVILGMDFDPRHLTAMASRIVRDDLLGLDKVMAPGTEILSSVVGTHADKLDCMAAIAAFADRVGVPRRYREPVEQCLDEMLMNALYDAPVDAKGVHIFAGVPTKKRITMRTQQAVTVQYGFDGKQLAVSVRDAFGSLERATVVRHFYKGVHARDQVEHKAGGAGLGLYLMANSTTSMYFHVLPGIATEAICVFDLERPKLQLEQLGFFVQNDLAGRVPTAPARRISLTRARNLARAGAAIAAVALVVVGVLAWQRLFGPPPPAQITFTTIPPGATIEVDGRVVEATVEVASGRSYPVVARLDGYESKQTSIEPHAGANEVTLELRALARVELDTQPTDATVEIDGKPVGSTPLTLTSLEPGATVSVVFKRPGYRPATARLEVPAVGKVKRVVQPLEVSEDVVRVHFVSTPPGAEVRQTGQLVATDRTYTPADVFVEVDKVQRFTLTMPRHVPVVIEPFTAHRGEQGLEKGGTLVEGAILHLEAASPGKVTVARAPHCTELAVPADCTLAPGSYDVEYVGADTKRASRTIVLVGRDETLKF